MLTKIIPITSRLAKKTDYNTENTGTEKKTPCFTGLVSTGFLDKKASEIEKNLIWHY